MKTWVVGVCVAAACGGKPGREPPPVPTAPLPAAALAGQQVSLLPLTLVAADESLHWDALVADRRGTLDRCDSILVALLEARAPEVQWISPEALRREARRAPGIAADPDRMGTAVLRARNLTIVPDPLRGELRTLAALAGGRYALIPATLIYRRTSGAAEVVTATAELSIVLADTRTGRIEWRTVAWGEGGDPWTALTGAVKRLTPGVP